MRPRNDCGPNRGRHPWRIIPRAPIARIRCVPHQHCAERVCDGCVVMKREIGAIPVQPVGQRDSELWRRPLPAFPWLVGSTVGPAPARLLRHRARDRRPTDVDRVGNISTRRMCPPRLARKHSKPSRKRCPVVSLFSPRDARSRLRIGTVAPLDRFGCLACRPVESTPNVLAPSAGWP